MACNWRSLNAFLDCSTQWRTAATMVGLVWIGLDYASVKIVLDLEGHEPAVFSDIRAMEDAALPILNDLGDA